MKVLIVLLIISLLGNAFGLFVLYKFMQKDKYLQEVMSDLQSKDEVLAKVNRDLDTRLVFVHHSVGRNILDEGGLRDSLTARGIAVRSVTYGCPIGEKTDMGDWLPKFRDHLEQIIRFDQAPDIPFGGTEENDIIMFKSCYPNSDIVAEGSEPGDPTVPTASIANYEAVLGSIEPFMAEHPNKLFIYVTAPPRASEATTPDNAARARKFNQWVMAEFVKKYTEQTGKSNLRVFDLYSVLADPNTNCLREEYKTAPDDSHPNRAGSRAAAMAFLKFLDENDIKAGHVPTT